MMNYSKCVFKIENTGKVFRTAEDGEKFYLVDVSIDGDIFPGVVSEYYIPLDKPKTNYAVDCYIKVEDINGKFFTYISIINAKEVADDVEEKSGFVISGIIQKNSGVKQKRNSVDILLIKIKCTNREGKATLIHAILKGSMARKYHDIEVGTEVYGMGHLHWLHRCAIELVFDEEFVKKAEVVKL